MNKTKKNRMLRQLLLMLCDVALLIASGCLASWIVFGGFVPHLAAIVTIDTLALLLVLFFVRFYWIHISESSLDLLGRALTGFVPVFLISIVSAGIIDSFSTRWIPFLIVMDILGFMLMSGMRVGVRYAVLLQYKHGASLNPEAIIYGAGELGSTLVRQAQKGNLPYRITGFIDDNPDLQGSYVMGIKVVGTVEELKTILEESGVTTLIIAITNIEQGKMFRALDAATECKCDVKAIPSLFELQQGAKQLDLRKLDYGDLLGRPLISIDRKPIAEMVKDRRILITGAGGSIGSEICRQLLTYEPKQLILLDIDETELHDLALRLTNWQSEWNERIVPVVCDIKNRKKIDRVFAKFQPQLVFHAAAYKHVPLQELYPEEAITTNIAGSYHVLKSAKDHGCERVVVISTDKAVNPTNVMGATKRVVELLAGMLNSEKTEMVCVRFGNVLGSRGSMLPLFLEQIHAGVPLTVTHRDIIRYFMAIPEAVSLVFKAASMAKGGEVMVLDMGQPVKIYDFAQKLVKYYGDGRSQVVITGLRPGEKLYEELLADKDTTIPTEDKLVFKAKLMRTKIDEKQFLTMYDSLFTSTPEQLVAELQEMVPEFSYQERAVAW